MRPQASAPVSLLRILGVLLLAGILIAIILRCGRGGNSSVSGDVNSEATIVGPVGGCSANESVCVTLPVDQPPIDVNIVGGDVELNANVSVELPTGEQLSEDSVSVVLAVDHAPVPVQLDPSLFEQCSANNSLCVSISGDQDPIEIVLPLGSLTVNESLSVTLAEDHPSIDVEWGAAFGQCSENNSLCVSISGDQEPLEIVLPLGSLSVNESLSVTLAEDHPPIDVDWGAAFGQCSENNSLCVSLPADQVVQVEIVGPLGPQISNQSLSVTIASDQAPLDVSLTGDFIGAGCSANESICVSVSSDAGPVEVELTDGHPPIDVNLVQVGTGECNASNALCVNVGNQEPLDVNVVNTNFTFDIFANVTLQPLTQLEIVSPLGSQPVADSVSVTFASDQGPLDSHINGNHTDQFGRIRIAEAHTIFDVKMLNDQIDGLNFDNQQTSGGGTTSTYVQSRASIFLGVAASTAGHRVRQTLRRFNYQPGKGMYILMTLVVGDTPTGITKRWGYYDQSNGVFFEARDQRIYAVRRSSVTGVPVDSYTDVTDSMPPSWSPDHGAIYGFDFAWLGVGETQFLLYNETNKHIVFQSDVGLPSVTMSNPNNPLRYEIINDGTGPAETLECICATVQSEGGVSPIGWPNSVNRGASTVSVTTDGVVHSLLAVRLRAGYEYSEALITDWTLSSTTGNVVFLYELRYRPVVAGNALVWTDVPNSPLQVALPVAANTITGGELVSSGYVTGTAQTSGQISATPQSLFLGSLIDGTRLELHIAVRRLDTGGGSDSFLAAMGLRSIF